VYGEEELNEILRYYEDAFKIYFVDDTIYYTVQ